MSTLASLMPSFQGFSCPFEFLHEEILEVVSGFYGQAIIKQLLEKEERVSCAIDPALLVSLERLMKDQTSFELTWDIAFGELFSALSAHTEINADVMASVGLRLSEYGLADEWELSLPVSGRHFFAGTLLPTADSMSVKGDANELEITRRVGQDSQSINFKRINGAWSSSQLQQMTYFEVQNRKVFVTPPYGVLENVDSETSQNLCAQMSTVCQGAIRFLEAHSAEYVPWVSRMVRYIVPVSGSAITLKSSSDYAEPGVLRMSYHENPILIAEMLVHEASHQYKYFLDRLGEVHDGSDRQLYFSPFKNQYRPIEAIVIAYHAFGNVLLFYEQCLNDGIARADLEHCQNEVKRLLPSLTQLHGVLRSTTSLTALGHALLEPLVARIVV